MHHQRKDQLAGAHYVNQKKALHFAGVYSILFHTAAPAILIIPHIVLALLTLNLALTLTLAIPEHNPVLAQDYPGTCKPHYSPSPVVLNPLINLHLIQRMHNYQLFLQA